MARRAEDRRRRLRRKAVFFVAALGVVVALGVASLWRLESAGDSTGAGRSSAGAQEQRDDGGSNGGVASPTPDPAPTPEAINQDFEGLTTFRGNATRTYYGEGPLPSEPEVLWRYAPDGGLCAESNDGAGVRLWCGTGWTGQPNVVETEGGRVQVRFGAYDRAIHVLDGKTGEAVKEPFVTGDIIKGTVTSDPDGYPLLYSGSRDNYLRILALDRGPAMEELWRLGADSAPNPMWNDDWDGSPLVIGDYLLEGGENSWFYVIKLNRGYDDNGKVTVDPEIRALVPGFDDQLLADVGDGAVSIESSVAFHDGVAYFGNSAGLIQGWDISRVLKGGDDIKQVFRFWAGDDTDASIVIDDEGFLYVAAELERFTARSSELGQLMKLDPSKPKRPLVWGLPVGSESGGVAGIWGTPALHENALFITTDTGGVWAVDRETGKVAWKIDLPPPTWSSPVVIDDTLVVGDCQGNLHAYELGDDPLERKPRELWQVDLGGCIESTPAVWKGTIYVGDRSGGMNAIGDR